MSETRTARLLPIEARRLSAEERSLILFAALAIAVIAALFSALQSMAGVWVASSVYHHGFFVAPLALWMIARERMCGTPAPDLAGIAIIAAAGALFLLGRAASVDLIQHGALVTALIGAVVASFGREQAQRWAFPLGFLFFMVPFGEELTPLMQHTASVAVAAALNASGVETLRDGFILSTSGGRFEMAASCAGLRFLLAAAMISTLVSFLAFRSFGKRALFIGASLAVALLANWMRAFALVYATTVTEGRIGAGPEHVALGWAFYVVLILGMMALAQRFADTDGRRSAVATGGPKRTPHTPAMIVAAGGALLLAVSLHDRAVISRTVYSPIASSGLASPAFESVAAPDDWRAFAPAADRLVTQGFRSSGRDIIVSAAAFAADRAGAEIAGAATRAADGEDWRRIAIASQDFTIGGRRVTLRLETIANAAGERLDVATLYRLGDSFHGSAAVLKLAIAMRRLLGQPTEGAAIFIATPADEDSRARIAAFLAGAE